MKTLFFFLQAMNIEATCWWLRHMTVPLFKKVSHTFLQIVAVTAGREHVSGSRELREI